MIFRFLRCLMQGSKLMIFSTSSLLRMKKFPLRLRWWQSNLSLQELLVWTERITKVVSTFGIVGLFWFRCKGQSIEFFNRILHYFSTFSFDTLMEETKLVVFEKCEYEYREKSKLIALLNILDHQDCDAT